MKYRKIIYVVLFSLTIFICQAQIHDKVSINLADFKSEKIREFDRISWKSDFKTVEEGLPELPVYRVTYVLPINAKISGVTFSSKEKQLLKKDIYIYPVQPPIPLNNTKSIDFKRPDEKTYNSDEPYPGKRYKIESDDIYQGYHIVTLQIFPFEYIPKSRKLNYFPNLEYTIEYENMSAQTIAMSENQTVTRADLCKKAVKSIVKNKQDVDMFGSDVVSLSVPKKTAQSGMQKIKNLSINDEIVPDYIIITCDSLKTAFKPIADWKTQKGLFTIIKTTEEIAASFPGSDLQEKIRNYLISAKEKWGFGLFVLLGGNINIIPSRNVHGVDDALDYPTDKYYSTSDTWTCSSGKFKGSYTRSLFNYVGRIPVNNTAETNIYINKLIAYEKADSLGDLNYLKNNLYADAYMEYDDNGNLCNFFHQYIKSYVQSEVPNTINNIFMCDNANCSGNTLRYLSSTSNNYYSCGNGNVNGDIELNRYNFLSCLNTGSSIVNGKFHFIFHLDHSGANGMGISGKDKGEGIRIPDMDSLSNGNSYQILFSEGCHPANFQYECMGKRYIVSSHGGVAFIGNTDVGYQGEYPQLKGFLQSLYKSGRYDIGNAFQNALLNYSDYSSSWKLHLLGDPEMQIWTDVPKNLSVLLNPVAVTLGTQTVNVAVSGLATGDTARICLWKGTEVYVTKEKVTNGTYPISFTANTPGEIKVTVTAHNFKPSERIITVNSTNNPNLSVSTVDFGDGIVQGLGVGNGNGQNDAGETIKLTLGIKNTGVNTANGVTATLTSSSPFINITSSQGSFGNIGSGVTATSNQFNYTILKSAPGKNANGIARSECLTNDKNPVSFTVTMKDATNTTWTHNYNIDVFKDSIMQRNKSMPSRSDGSIVIVAGQTNTINIDLQNIGHSQAIGLKATLSRNAIKDINNYITNCSDTIRTYPVLNQFDDLISTMPYRFNVSSTYPGGTTPLWFNLKVENAYGKTWNLPFNLMDKPLTVPGLDFTSDVSEIDLFWKKPATATGYNIYRCDADQVNDTEVGSYVKLNNTPLTYSFYNDTKNLHALKKYFYKVAAVSTSGNEGLTSTILAWTSYSHKNLYPIMLDASLGNTHTSVNVADVNYDGKKEIFIGSTGGSAGGYLEGLNDNGDELYNIDNNVTTYSGFAKLNGTPWAVPAIGDLNKKGEYQIVEPTRTDNQQDNYIACLSANDTNPHDGKPDSLWNNFTPQKRYYRGVVMSNIDNSADGSLEVITCSDVQGAISIYNASGTLLRNIPCVNTYGAIAVADINGDGYKEIIQASENNINVWKYDGNYYKGNNPSIYQLPLSGYRFVSSVIVCNIDSSQDGRKEILTFAIKESSPNQIKLFAIDYNGNALSGFNGTQDDLVYTNNDYYQELSVGDLNHDGYFEVVTLAKDGIKVWNHTGQLIQPISSTPISDINTASLPILADVDGDSNADIVYVSNTSNNIYAYKLLDGKKVLGFPLRLSSGWCYGLNISDIDNDGHNEIIAGNASKVQMWQSNGTPAGIEWGSERHDQYNTGEYQTICDPTLITSAVTWNSNQSICGDLVLKSGTLTINNSSNITLGSSSMIIVMSGASLVIDSGHILNANVRALAGSNVTIRNNGSITLRSNAEFYTETGTTVDIPYGSIDK